jgi:hypothetical protein
LIGLLDPLRDDFPKRVTSRGAGDVRHLVAYCSRVNPMLTRWHFQASDFIRPQPGPELQ